MKTATKIAWLGSALMLMGIGVARAELQLLARQDGTIYIANPGTVPFRFDGYQFSSASGILDPAGWVSLAQSFAEDPAATSAALGVHGMFTAGNPSQNSLAEISGGVGATLQPGARWSIGKPFGEAPAGSSVFDFTATRVRGVVFEFVNADGVVTPQPGGGSPRVEVDTAIRLSQPFGEYELSISDGRDFFFHTLGFQPDGTVWRPTLLSLSRQAEWYLAEEDTVFSDETIAAGAFQPFDGNLDLGSFGEHYLAVRWPSSGARDDTVLDLFGWAKVRFDSEGIEMLENAVAIGYEGIVVGTTQTVPEPATWIPCSLAALAFIMFG